VCSFTRTHDLPHRGEQTNPLHIVQWVVFELNALMFEIQLEKNYFTVNGFASEDLEFWMTQNIGQ
jgi:hypothetical protein